MIPTPLRIEGMFGGVDPIFVLLLIAATAGAIVATTAVARNLQRMQPKAAAPQQVQKLSGEFDAWTERPKSQAQQNQEYYSLYGSMPGQGSVSAPRSMSAPPPPSSVAPMGPVVIDLSGNAPRQDDWFAGASAPAMHPPAALKQTGPTDDVVAPTHGRRVRDTATGELPPREATRPSFERQSIEGGAVAPYTPPARSAPARSAAPDITLPPAPPSPPPPSQLARAQIADALPEGLNTQAASKTAFRGPSRGQTVVGAGQTGVQEGQVLTPATKSIRCPKCQTVFVGPAARPATVKCPACGTTGTLK